MADEASPRPAKPCFRPKLCRGNPFYQPPPALPFAVSDHEYKARASSLNSDGIAVGKHAKRGSLQVDHDFVMSSFLWDSGAQ